LKSVLSLLKVKCTFERDGCQQVLTYDTLTKHEQKCDYRSSTCKGCGKMLVAKELLKHEELCEDVSITCELCQSALKRQEYLIHVKDKFACMSVKMEKMRMASEEQMRKEMAPMMKEMVAMRNMYEKQTNELRQDNQELIKNVRLIMSELQILSCGQGHKLQYYSIIARHSGKNFKCDQCQTTKSGASLHCPDCGYNICQDCKPPHFSQNVCFHNHSLHPMQGICYTNKNIHCDKCGGNVMDIEQSIGCNICKFFLCNQCAGVSH